MDRPFVGHSIRPTKWRPGKALDLTACRSMIPLSGHLLPGDSKTGGCRAAVERWCVLHASIHGFPTRSAAIIRRVMSRPLRLVYSSRRAEQTRPDQIRSAPARAAARCMLPAAALLELLHYGEEEVAVEGEVCEEQKGRRCLQFF
jgi:hypothetical protein